jgi:hypothetical protein
MPKKFFRATQLRNANSLLTRGCTRLALPRFATRRA